MPRVVIPNDFEPRPYQRNIMNYMDRGGRRAVWVVHRRGGKDLTMMHQTCKAAHRRTAAYWHVFPTAEQGRKAIWEGFTRDGKRIMEQVFPVSIRKSPREFLPKAEMVVELLCGSVWRLLGSDKVDLVGAGPAGVTFSEYSLAKPSAWDYIRPMLRENDGWASFIFTPRGRNHGWDILETARREQGWFHEVLPLTVTRAYDPEETMREERSSGMPEPLIRQEYLCDFDAANVGSVWGELIAAMGPRVLAEFAHDFDGAFTTWDLGRRDKTAIWTWFPGPEGPSLVDYYEASGRDLDHYLERLAISGYRYNVHYLPHDSTALTLNTKVSVYEQCVEWASRDPATRGEFRAQPRLPVEEGIAAVRRMLRLPGTRFHKRTREGVAAARAYHFAWDPDRKQMSVEPEHDWSSHCADALRGVALCERVIGEAHERRRHSVQRRAPGPVLDELFREHERAARHGTKRI